MALATIRGKNHTNDFFFAQIVAGLQEIVYICSVFRRSATSSAPTESPCTQGVKLIADILKRQNTAKMKKPYDMHEEESQNPQVQDDSVVEYATTTQLPPYTMEELNARIDEAEAEFEAGRRIPSTEVFAHVRQMLINRL